MPAGLRRLVRPVGGEGTTYVLLEEMIRAELAALFPGQHVLESAVFRIARDAEMELDDEGGGDYLEAIEEELRKRRRSRGGAAGGGGRASATTCSAMLAERLEVDGPDVYRVARPARRARAACRSWSCPRWSTCASRR